MGCCFDKNGVPHRPYSQRVDQKLVDHVGLQCLGGTHMASILTAAMLDFLASAKSPKRMFLSNLSRQSYEHIFQGEDSVFTF